MYKFGYVVVMIRFYGVINAVIGNPVYNDNIEIFTASTGNIVSRKIMSNEIFENNGWIGYFSELTEEPQLFNDNESASLNASSDCKNFCCPP